MHPAERGIPFIFKQIGGKNRDKGGRPLDGREWNQFAMEL